MGGGGCVTLTNPFPPDHNFLPHPNLAAYVEIFVRQWASGSLLSQNGAQNSHLNKGEYKKRCGRICSKITKNTQTDHKSTPPRIYWRGRTFEKAFLRQFWLKFRWLMKKKSAGREAINNDKGRISWTKFRKIIIFFWCRGQSEFSKILKQSKRILELY